jgi:hypothetical protein
MHALQQCLLYILPLQPALPPIFLGPVVTLPLISRRRLLDRRRVRGRCRKQRRGHWRASGCWWVRRRRRRPSRCAGVSVWATSPSPSTSSASSSTGANSSTRTCTASTRSICTRSTRGGTTGGTTGCCCRRSGAACTCRTSSSRARRIASPSPSPSRGWWGFLTHHRWCQEQQRQADAPNDEGAHACAQRLTFRPHPASAGAVMVAATGPHKTSSLFVARLCCCAKQTFRSTYCNSTYRNVIPVGRTRS